MKNVSQEQDGKITIFHAKDTWLHADCHGEVERAGENQGRCVKCGHTGTIRFPYQ